jgi:hypothetical protein
MTEAEWRILDPRGGPTRAQHFRIRHRHGERWEEAHLVAAEIVVELGERKWRAVYVCACGATVEGQVPG